MKEATKMAIKLNLKKSIIPVEIGDFKFEVDLSDEKANAFEEAIIKFLKGIKELSNEAKNESKLGDLLEDAFDELLGEGAFEKLYGYAKRLDSLAELFNELILELVSKLPGRSELIHEIRSKKQLEENL